MVTMPKTASTTTSISATFTALNADVGGDIPFDVIDDILNNNINCLDQSLLTNILSHDDGDSATNSFKSISSNHVFSTSSYITPPLIKPLAPPPKLHKVHNFESNSILPQDYEPSQQQLPQIKTNCINYKVHSGQELCTLNSYHTFEKKGEDPNKNLSSTQMIEQSSHKYHILKRKERNPTSTYLHKATGFHGTYDQSQAFVKKYIQSSSTKSDDGKLHHFCCQYPTDVERNQHQSLQSSGIQRKRNHQALSTAKLPPTLSTLSTLSSRAKTKKTKICRMDKCENPSDIRSPYCKSHRGQRKCEHEGCTKYAQSKTRFCIGHGGGRRCQFPNCNKSARDQLFCVGHGGGKRCITPRCRSLSVGGDDYCTAHGGGRRCEIQGCPKSAQSTSNFCVKHGGGRKCKVNGCGKVGRGKLGLCSTHQVSDGKEKLSSSVITL